MANIYRTHTCGELSEKNAGTDVVLSGWLHRKRDHGGLLFVDLRDNYGIMQCVFANPAQIEKVHPESVLRIRGTVVRRTDDQINPKFPTGTIEIKVEKFDVLSESAPLPFQVFGDDDTPEELRFAYRSLDLRREKLHGNILLRNRVVKWLRDRMWSLGFSEFQTPNLSVSTPEGARDFLIPSRVHHGKFYALPQSPQQYKQLLMMSGFDKYFQIAPCFRDEDSRADRLLEHYQLDVEMSFVEIPDIQAVAEAVFPDLVREFAPNADVAVEIPHISHDDAMLKYGIDKPDLRNPILISDVSDIFAGADFDIFANAVANGSVVRAIPAPKTAGRPRSWFDRMGAFAVDELKLAGLGYIVFENGDSKGPVAKKLDAERIRRIKNRCGLSDGDSVFFVCEREYVAAKSAGKLRLKCGEDLELVNQNEFRFCWIEDFPFFEKNEETGRPDFGHNPFSLPKGGAAALDNPNVYAIKANQFDFVVNGMELGSGGLRNYNPDVMLKAFALVGYDEDYVKNRFGGMWRSFQYGAPPEGGFGFGIDRLIAQLAGETAIREIVAFPMNQRGQDLLLGSPADISEQQLREVHIRVR